MEMIDIKSITNWSPILDQTYQAWNRLRSGGNDIEVKPVCPGTGRNFDNSGAHHAKTGKEDGESFVLMIVNPKYFSRMKKAF